MNILYLCDEYPPGRHGGIGTVVQLLARQLVKQGHNVVVAGFYDWGYGGEDEFDDEGVKVYRFRRGLSSSLFEKQDSLPVRALYKLLTKSRIFQLDIQRSLKKYQGFIENLVQQYRIDIIEMADYNDYLRFCFKAVMFPQLSVPVVVKLHGSMTYFGKEAGQEVPQYIQQVEKDILLKAAKVAGVSRYTAENTEEYLQYPGKIDVLYNGIAMPEVKLRERKKGKVVFTGSLLHKKGIYSLVQAWNKVTERHPEAVLEVYGKGPVEKIKSDLSAKALPTVHFNGHAPRQVLFDNLADANLAIFPSYAECFALGPMEAMACGTAVIYTVRTSGRELIDDMENGMLIEPSDIDEIAQKICYLIENPDFCTAIAKAGKDKVHRDFSIEVITQKHVTYYNNVLNLVV